MFFALTDFKKEVEPYLLKEFLKNGYVTDNKTLVKGIVKVQPGTWMIVDLNNENSIDVKEYWKLVDFYKEEKYNKSFETAVEESHGLIKSACQYRMVADVPVGIFLSGGFDSSLVTSILQKNNNTQLKTFTIGFPDGVDESPDAERIAEHIGTNHTTYHCTFKDAKELIPQLPFLL